MANETKTKKPIWKRWWVWVIIIFVIFYIALEQMDKATQKSPQQRAEENAKKVYEQLITDNAVTVIEKIPKYASIQSKACAYKDGFLIEDIYNAEWYINGNTIFAVNGLAKSLTPDIDYAPAEISYQPCY